jgi:hypothetical protein
MSTEQQTAPLTWWRSLSADKKLELTFKYGYPAGDVDLLDIYQKENPQTGRENDPFTPGEREVLWYYWVRVKGKGFWEPAQCFGHTWQIIGESTYYTDDQMEKIGGKILSHFVENAVKNF